MSVIELITELTQQDIRLWLEDGQLRFSAPKGGMSDATRQLLKENKMAIIDFLDQSQANTGSFITPVDNSILQPLSYAQERIWFLSQLEPGNTAFHLPIIFEMHGELDIPLLERILNTLIARHRILRTAYLQTTTGTYQQVLPEKTVTLNLCHRDEPDLSAAELGMIARQETGHLFDLESGDVTHNLLLVMPDNHYFLFFTIHHIATDGWSMAIIAREIAELYSACSQHKPPVLEPMNIGYADFAVWQRQYLQQQHLQEQLEYWHKLLHNHNNLKMPTDFPRPAITQSQGASLKFMINQHPTAQLNNLARDNNTTLFVVLLSLFGTLLYRYSQQQSFCIGTPVAGRLNSQCESLVGCFLNLLAIQVEHQSSDTFIALLEKNRNTVQAAFTNQEAPFEEIVKTVVTTRNLSLTPVFQVMFSFQNTPFERITHIENIQITPVEPEKHAAMYDITLTAKEWGGEIYAEFDYKTELFKTESMQAFMENFQRLIDTVITHPQQAIGILDFTSAGDKQKQLHDWNQTTRLRNTHTTIAAFIEDIAATTPDAVAVCYQETRLSYQELDTRSNQLARHLQQTGIHSGSLVGVYLERSLHLPVALLAILKAGAAYLPLDLSFPDDRLNTISHDAGLQWIITRSDLKSWQMPDKLHVVNMDDATLWQKQATNPLTMDFHQQKPLMNVIYTSGSTGKPKGVMVSQAAIINRLLWMQETFPLDSGDRVLHKTPYSFDVSVWEIFWPLIVGAQLVIAEPDGHKNPAYLRDTIINNTIHILHFVPSMLSVFLQTENLTGCTSVKKVFCSGETLSPSLASEFYRLFPDATLINLYGPTETAIDVSYHVCPRHAPGIPLGKPISNTRLYILDEQQAVLPVGAAGEIYIGGDGLAEGYLGKPEMTSQKFIPDPFNAGSRLYKTGDHARFDHEGNLLFLGRTDQQIKVRGFRVELGEIENCLNRHPAIRESLIISNTLSNNDQRIIAYYITSTSIEPADLRHYLADRLPSFMIPNGFVEIAEWPLGYNGKINRNALPDPDQHNLHIKPFVAPASALEQDIATIWSELLNITEIGIHDNFFELGGHSLLATMAISRMQNTFDVKIPLSQIFKEPTIANFSRVIAQAQLQKKNMLSLSSDLSQGDTEKEITQ